MLKEFGGVIFTRSDNKKINRINDLDGVVFGGVSELSFGGWIMAYEELIEHGIKKDDIKLKFLNTHDDVVKAVVSGEIDAGTVRSGTIERMASEGLVNLSTVKIINEQKYDGFPYLVSTKLYPEWPFAKLKHTSDILSNKLLSELVQLTPKSIIVQEKNLDAWTVPLDYSSVHAMLKKLRISPYDNVEIKFIDILEQYAFYIYFIAILGILLILRLVYAKNKNDYLSLYSKKLDDEVQERTRELNEANEKLKVLASTDFLTGINNRGSFMNLAQKYFDIAKRNNTSLEILSLDLDHFKSINDTYGHEAGDKVLIEFTNTVKRLLRDSDVFGRTGGEEFCIILQNTSPEGSYVFAERLRQSVEDTKIEYEGKSIKVTVSIGMAAMDKEENIKDLIKKSDVALYKAKESGRNKVHVV